MHGHIFRSDGDRFLPVLQHLEILAFPQRRLEPRLAGQFAQRGRQPAEEGCPFAPELAQRLPVTQIGRVEPAAAEQQVARIVVVGARGRHFAGALELTGRGQALIRRGQYRVWVVFQAWR